MTQHPMELDLLRRYLAEGDVACPGCGYSLHALTEHRCPECNQPLELGVRLAEPKLGQLLAAVIGLGSGVGAAAYFLVMAGTISLVFGQVPPLGAFWIPGLWLAVEGSVFAALLSRRGRMWFRTGTSSGRNITIVWCWSTTVVFAAVLMSYIIATW